MNVSGKTKITGIFGYPIEHTLSPLMHNTAFENLKLDHCYVPFLVKPDDLTSAVKSIRALNMLGVNITVPHKENVLPLLDKIDKEAAFIGAVNTITNENGILTGYNTDGRGFMSSLEEEGVSVEGKDVLIIGTGGACRAISYYLSEKASKLSIFDIDKQKAEKLANDLKEIRDNIHLLDSIEETGKPDIIINATPLGMKPDDPSPIDSALITSDMAVYDLVYKTTALLKEADSRGAKTINGSGMLLWQGVLAFKLWTGVMPPVDLMRRMLIENIK
ncbi:MAG TPA: shikimate dehydrogenase [Nitrospirae bacterium]|nr:shikimate dehydrogenase [bacterium BMS3Abin09]GBE41280.1 shikimate dehydrogenase [bacterium BMS3Bbin09]HDH34497.1 shikimate dehydrogenase [Nitrospirota bacterium]HDN94734.1 shikimate dehydrogenase [Nitrospirota bacterium]HDO67175.1 shikimate dehydrogenase [Nitrospirota bacterium]